MTIATALLGAVGLGLLGFETAEAMRNVIIGTTGTVLIYVGMGMTVIAAALVVISLTTSPAPTTTAEAPVADELADESAT
jgi:hypothetical protein